jgi:hypothetical protein
MPAWLFSYLQRRIKFQVHFVFSVGFWKEIATSNLLLRQLQRRQSLEGRLRGDLLNHTTFLQIQIKNLANVRGSSNECAWQTAPAVGMCSRNCAEGTAVLCR